MAAEAAAPRRQSTRFLLLYALASAGGAIAYVPFLTLLLPARMAELAGAADVEWLGYSTFLGAVAASIGGIVFGWLSDRTGDRRGWIAGGLLLAILLLLAVPLAKDVTALVAIIVAWQLALNMMLGPLAAWGGDLVPDEQKGLLGGLLALSPALGAWSGALVTLPGVVSLEQRLVVIAALMALAILPALLAGRPQPFPQLIQRQAEGEAAKQPAQPAVRMWLARLLVQIAEAALFAYLYFWFRSIDPAMGDHEKAGIFSIALTIAVPVALLAGRWADRNDRPFTPLILAAALSSVGLVGMALAGDAASAKAAYLGFGIATTVFLSLHSGQMLRVLPRPERRGRDLGLFNLTNTIPSLIMPWLTISLVPSFGFSTLFLLLAGLAGCAVLLLATLPRRA
ncbi:MULTISPECIES: MFS transporter [unclassified Sphingopyxis]|uniref:MFS transporter n=1 Tax=unclassified Sphingopyxis TaxID=2614943 RepID=UPI0024ADC85C|nr:MULTISPECIES: MFS transporter [unclassified Sphingopyxis]